MRLQPERPAEPPHALLTRLASLSPRLRAFSEALNREPGAATLSAAFEDEQAAKARDLRDRKALAGRDVIAREPEAFELFGRVEAIDWLCDMRRLENWNARNDGRDLSAKRAEQAATFAADLRAAYVVMVCRIDRAGRKLGKFLVPRFPENGALPVDEDGAIAWALIPGVEWWATRCDAHPAAETRRAGSQFLADGFDEGAR